MDAIGLTLSLLQLTTSIIHYLGDVKDAPEDRRLLLAEMSSIAGSLYVLKDSAERAKQSTSPSSNVLTSLAGPSGPLEQLKSTLDLLAAKLGVTDGSRKTAFKAFIRPFQKAEVNEILAKIERQKTLLILALQNDTQALAQQAKITLMDMHNDVQHISTNVDDIRRQQLDEERQRMFRWLSPLNPRIKQRDVAESRQPCTGKWMLESPKFRAWLKGPEPRLWCPGVPGAGKTTLISLVIDHLNDTYSKGDTGIAYIYCSHRARDQTAVNVLCCILQQLAEKQESVIQHVMSLYQRHLHEDTRPQLSEVVRSLHMAVGEYQQIFIAIDALDECSESDRQAFLAHITQLPSNVHVLVTSRPIPSIASDFGAAACLQIEARECDIEPFLRAQIRESTKLKKCIKAEPGLEEAILNAIIRKAGGMFLLPRLHIALLSRKRSPRDVRLSLEALPKELDATYNEAMERIGKQSEEDVDLALRVLSLIVSAHRTLTIGELQDALITGLSQDPGFDESALIDEEDISSVCLGLVTIRRHVITLVHYTAENYFKNPEKTKLLDRNYMARQCILCLSAEPSTEDTPNLVSSAMESRVGHRFLSYASKYWGHHLEKASDKDLQVATLKFLKDTNKVSRACENMRISQNANLRQNRVTSYGLLKFNGLHLAAFFGLYDIAKELLEDLRIGANLANNSGWTPLAIAIRQGNMSLARLLAENPRVDIKLGHLSGAGTALHVAAASPGEQTAFVKWLLREGASINSLTDNKLTPLHVASEVGHESIVRVFLEAGSDARALTIAGTTPLYRSIRSGNTAVVDVLLQQASDVNVRTWDSWTPLHEAACRGDQAMLKRLIAAGADLSIRTLNGELPLDFAAISGKDETAKYIQKVMAEQGNLRHIEYRLCDMSKVEPH